MPHRTRKKLAAQTMHQAINIATAEHTKQLESIRFSLDGLETVFRSPPSEAHRAASESSTARQSQHPPTGGGRGAKCENINRVGELNFLCFFWKMRTENTPPPGGRRQPPRFWISKSIGLVDDFNAVRSHDFCSKCSGLGACTMEPSAHFVREPARQLCQIRKNTIFDDPSHHFAKGLCDGCGPAQNA